MNPTTVSATASHQHQQEQEMLASFAVPNPPLSTQQSQYLEDETITTSTNNEENGPRTLWMGDLDPWLEEPSIESLWWQILNKKVQVKVIRPRFPKPDINLNGSTHSGYCFIEFESFNDAKQALSLNGQLLPDVAMPSQKQFPNNPDNQKKYFRLNWASGATLSAPIIQSPEFSLFVGDLSASTTEAHLLAFFQKLFPTSVKTVRVMTDPVSGKSRCFGFVRFSDELERQRALIEMNGVWFGGRPLRVALATPRNNQNQNQNNNLNNLQFNQFNPSSPNPMGVNVGQFQNQFSNNSYPVTPNQFPSTPNLGRNNMSNNSSVPGSAGVPMSAGSNGGYYDGHQDLMFTGGFGYYPPMIPILPENEPQTPSEGGYSHGSNSVPGSVPGSVHGSTSEPTGTPSGPIHSHHPSNSSTSGNNGNNDNGNNDNGIQLTSGGGPPGSLGAIGQTNSSASGVSNPDGSFNDGNSTNNPINSNQTGDDYSNLNSPVTAVSTNNNSLQGQPFNDPTNTTVFVGGLSSDVSEQTLFTLFKSFGIIQQIKIPPGKNCGFVKYSTREEAEDAIAAMQGYIIGGNRVRLSWGRVSMNNKKFYQQQQQVAQAAQIQAAALSMGLDPASAIAAAAAAATGGYPGMPPQGIPPQGMPPQGMPPHGIPPQGILPQGMPPQGIPPQGMPPQGIPPQHIPPLGQGIPQNMPPMGANMPPPIPISPQGVVPMAMYGPPISNEEGEEVKEEKVVNDDNELTDAMKSMNLEK